jgi:hypothetical protein
MTEAQKIAFKAQQQAARERAAQQVKEGLARQPQQTEAGKQRTAARMTAELFKTR